MGLCDAFQFWQNLFIIFIKHKLIEKRLVKL